MYNFETFLQSVRESKASPGEEINYNMGPSPNELEEIYNSGYCGVIPDRAAYYSLRTLAPRFYNVYPEAKGRGKGKASMPFKAALTLDKDFGGYESQTTGDCVSHYTRNAGMMDYCIDSLFGETKFKGRLATENIYGARGHAGQGANCSRLAEYVSQNGDGGFLPRDNYITDDGVVDLTVYDSQLGHLWGRRGTPSWLNKIASENKALRVFSLKSVEEMIDAFAMGFGITMCSSYGFSSTRNSDGVADKEGSWNHAMSWCGVDDTEWAHDKYGGPITLVQNSWGEWNTGGKIHDQPDGSFFIKPDVARNMIENGGGYVVASVRGYNRELVYDMQKYVEEISS